MINTPVFYFKRTMNFLKDLKLAYDYRKVKPIVDAKANDILRSYGLHAQLMPVRRVGVAGDRRVYKFALEVDGDYPNFDTLRRISNQLTNEIPEIGSVVLNITARDQLETS